MKPAPFDLVMPDTLAAAHTALGSGGSAMLLAGGQSLMLKLSLRLMRPDTVISLDRIAQLRAFERNAEGLSLGARLTHADIEDLPPVDRLSTILSDVAIGIGSRGIRNRATIGGCLANGDPCHDWLVALPALGACYRVDTATQSHLQPAAAWLPAPFSTSLILAGIIVSIQVPAVSDAAQWAYVKVAQKTNAAPVAIAAVLVDPMHARAGVAVGSAAGAASFPVLAAQLLDGAPAPDRPALQTMIDTAFPGADPLTLAMVTSALQRAIGMARA